MYLSALYLTSLLILTTIWHIVRHLSRIRARKTLALRHGCIAPASLPQVDKILGTDILFNEYANFKNNTYLSMLSDRFSRAGTTWSSRTFLRTNVATIDTENIKSILVTNSQDYALGRTRSSVLGATLDHGIFTAQGAEWRFLRRMSRRAFGAGWMRGGIEGLVERLLGHIPDGEGGGVVDLQPLLHDLTLHNATSMFFGRDAVRQLETGNFAERMNEAIVLAFSHTQDIMVLGPLAGVFQSRESKEAIGLVYGFIRDNCERAAHKRHQQEQSSPKEEEEEESAAAMLFTTNPTTDFEKIHIQLRQMFMAAEGTTAETLTHLFHLLTRHQNALSILLAEITSILQPGTLPTPSNLVNMPYLNACIKETLRLFPTVPFNNRVAVRDTVLPRGGGDDGFAPVLVPEGAEISLPHYPLYRRKDIFGEGAGEFFPERWLECSEHGAGTDSQRDRLQQDEAYLPFSIGKRACPGRQIALETVRYVAVRLVQELPEIWDASGGREWRENCGATLQSKYGAVVGVTRRNEEGISIGKGEGELDGDVDSGYSSEVAG